MKVSLKVLGKVPTISIDKTDGCQMYLSKDSLDVVIVSSKSSEMNVLLPTPSGDDYVSLRLIISLSRFSKVSFSFKVESPVPEQFRTTISGNSLHTSCVESLG